MNTIHNWVNTVLIGAIFLLVLVGGQSAVSFGASGTRMPNGISADTTSPVAGEVRGTTLTITSTSAFTGLVSAVTGAFSGLLTPNGGTLHSYTNSTTTTDTATPLIQADILNYDTILVGLNGGASTWTLPATSSLTDMIPTAGDMQTTCLLVSNATLTLAAGTGMDLEIASSTDQVVGASSLAIAAGNSACLNFIRATTTDVTVQLTRFINAD